MLDDHIEKEDGWFTNEDKALVYTIYPLGTTHAAIDAGFATPTNITGWAVLFLLKADPEDDDALALISASTAAGTIVLTGASGVATVTVTDANTEALSPGEFWHELKRVDPGLETVLSQGRVQLRRSLHKGDS